MQAGYYVSRSRAILVLVAFAVALVAVGLMAGLINQGCDDDAGNGPTTTQAPGTTTTTPPDLVENPWLDPFLPRNTVPVHYALDMNPDFYHDGNTFSGQEDIRINITAPTRFLIVHIKFMNITSTSVSDFNTGGQFYKNFITL